MGLLRQIRSYLGDPRNFEIQRLEADLATRDAELETMYGVIRGKTAEIDALRSEVAALHCCIAEMDSRRDELADAVDYVETPGLGR